MTLTIKDIRDRLAIMDEVTILELLDISSEQLVDRFEDLIEQRAEKLSEDLEEDNLYYGEDSDEWSSDEETSD